MQFRRTRTLLEWIVGIAIAAVVIGIIASYVVDHRWPHARAQWLFRAGRSNEAVDAQWRGLQRGPVTTERVVELIESSSRLRTVTAASLADDDDDRPAPPRQHAKPAAESPKPPTFTDADLRALLMSPSTPADARLLGLFWLDEELTGPIDAPIDEATERARADERAADETPPMPMANHLLARQSWSSGHLDEALERYRREVVFFGDAHRDASEPCVQMSQREDWAGAERWIRSPEIGRFVDGDCVLEVMVHQRQWGMAARGAVRAVWQRPDVPPLLMTITCGLAWLVFCAQLGQVRRLPKLRIPLYLSAIALGVLSIAPTLLLIEMQTQILHLKASRTGEPIHDLIFFTLGVGFREELSKLLLFIPLWPFIRRWGTRQDVFVTGALVGLGFAVEENLGYFSHATFADGVARFLTANFLHMSMTALTASAFDDFARDPGGKAYDASVTIFTVMGLHGIYDFFAVNHTYGNLGYFSMIVFVVLAKKFLDLTTTTVPRLGERGRLLTIFSIGTAMTTAVTFVIASALIGPFFALIASIEGWVGVAIISFMFVRGLEDR
ncbi:MAG: PrsW family glutamic-type intramembrane protease [Polyangiales bacterium]